MQLLRPVVPLMADGIGVGPGAVGLVLAAFSLVPALFAVRLGRAAEAVGLERAMGAAGLATAAAAGLYWAGGRTYAGLFGAQVVGGLAFLFGWIAVQTYVTFVARGDRRGQVVGIFSFFTGVGLAGGPVAGAWLFDRVAPGAAFGAYAALGLALWAAASALPRGREARGGSPLGSGSGAGEAAARQAATTSAPATAGAPARAGRRAVIPAARLARNPAVVLATGFSTVSLFVIGARNTFYPIALDRAGLDLVPIGLLMTLAGAASVAVRPLTDVLVGRYGLAALVGWASAGAALSMAATPLTARFGLLAALALSNGVAAGFHQPLSILLLARHTTAEERATAFGLFNAVTNLALAASPVLYGALASLVGLAGAFYAIGAGLAVAGAGLLVPLTGKVVAAARSGGSG